VTYDGVVSRYLNRPLSRPMARAVSGTSLTPNAVTGLTLLLAFATGGMIAMGWNIAGGIAIQAVSVIDGVDGELARLKNMSTRFGAVFDAVCDRYADAVIFAGMTVYAVRFEDYQHAGFVGMLAVSAVLIVSYCRARIEADLPDIAAGGKLDSIFGLASRDVRLLIAAIGTVTGQCFWTLAIIGVISALTIAWRLLYLRVKVGDRRYAQP
jgi:phosphatidylglycerophosphate synthase